MNFSVECGEDGYYTVRSGDRYQDKMDAGECLVLCARLLLGAAVIEKALQTKAEHDEWNEKYGFSEVKK